MQDPPLLMLYFQVSENQLTLVESLGPQAGARFVNQFSFFPPPTVYLVCS